MMTNKGGETMYYDVETGETLTETQLRAEYEDLRRNGETETETFGAYIKNCTDKNGTLIRR